MAAYVRPEVLTFPVKLEPLRLTRRCLGKGRLRVRVTGDVERVSFRLGGRERMDARAPFETTYPRSALRGRLAAVVAEAGRTRTLGRSSPRCGVSRAG